jgi:shikimate dehydrogenase
MRRTAAGWEGDMLDGIGMIQAIKAKHIQLKDKRAILAGAVLAKRSRMNY